MIAETKMCIYRSVQNKYISSIFWTCISLSSSFIEIQQCWISILQTWLCILWTMVVLSFHLTWCHWIWFFCYERFPHSCALVSGVLSCYKPISSVIFQKLDMIPALFHLLLKDFTSVKYHPTVRGWNSFHQEWDNFFFGCTLLWMWTIQF